MVRRMKFSHLVNSSHINGLNFCSKALTEHPGPGSGSCELGTKMSQHTIPVQCEVSEYLQIQAHFGNMKLVKSHPLGSPGNLH